ncbi:DUF4232 domain-containing protein [Streptomyces sp. NPDC050485]|uniref:DUF4232 domain-containing protein n=1 Tax=Streptomyces sp. NPDC050485 TaxID=3365617 RepID=UPI00378C583E
MRRGRTIPGQAGAALAGLVALLGALTGCTDGVPTAAPGTGASSARPGSPAPEARASQAQQPPAAPASPPGRSGTPQSPPPSAAPAAPPSPPAASPPPPLPGTDTRTGPGDDGGEDARTYCPPTALSFTFRTAGDARTPDNARTAGDARSAGDVRAGGDAVLAVRNTSGHACVLHGSPALTLTDDTGRSSLTSAPAKPYAQAFALHPGASGTARVHYAARRDCRTRGSTVRVTLPGSGTASTLPVLDAHGRPTTLPLCGPPLLIGPFKPGFG